MLKQTDTELKQATFKMKSITPNGLKDSIEPLVIGGFNNIELVKDVPYYCSINLIS